MIQMVREVCERIYPIKGMDGSVYVSGEACAKHLVNVPDRVIEYGEDMLWVAVLF
jgi:hypothetical protein